MKVRYILGFGIVVCLALVYYKFNPEMYRIFPSCPFHKYIGLDCPGCGSQRAVHALLHGDVLKAVNYNLLLVASIPLLLFHFLLKIYVAITRKPLVFKLLYHPTTPKIILVLVILFWVLRNIPYQPFNYLAA